MGGGVSRNPADVQEYMNSAWLNKNIKNNHGPLGAFYTQDYTAEGDSASFMSVIDNGAAGCLARFHLAWLGRPCRTGQSRCVSDSLH